jgi:hypothetical protein
MIFIGRPGGRRRAMRTHRPRVDATVLGAASLLALALGDVAHVAAPADRPPTEVVGHWRSVDGSVRLAMATDGTYQRSVAGRHRAECGTYWTEGRAVLLRADCGLPTTVTPVGEALEMAGHRLFRS